MWFWIIVGLVVLLIIIFIIWGATSASTSTPETGTTTSYRRSGFNNTLPGNEATGIQGTSDRFGGPQSATGYRSTMMSKDDMFLRDSLAGV